MHKGQYIFLKSQFWVTLCIATKLKAQSKLHIWTTLRISSSETAAEVKSSTVAGFSLLLIFLCNGAGRKRRDTERFWCDDDDPISPMLPAWLLSVCPQELYIQTRLQSLGVCLTDMKQRCPWWRSNRKTRKHSSFKHIPPTPCWPMFFFRSVSLRLPVLSLRRGWSPRRCCTCCCCLRGLFHHPVWCKLHPLRPDGGWRCSRRSHSSGQHLGQWHWLEPGKKNM